MEVVGKLIHIPFPLLLKLLNLPQKKLPEVFIIEGRAFSIKGKGLNDTWWIVCHVLNLRKKKR